MKQSRLFGIVLTVALAVLFFTAVAPAVVSAATIYVPEGGNQTIQQAVNNATAGDTIIVHDGTYHENVNVDGVAHLTIRSENGTANCIVNASDSNDYVFEVSRDYMNISGFTIENATGQGRRGIYLGGAAHCNISDNIVSNNYGGIRLESSSYNNITGNNVSWNTGTGILVIHSDAGYNNITDNIADHNGHNGIEIVRSGNCIVENNTANENNNSGIYLFDDSESNDIIGNTANSNREYGIHLCSGSDNNFITNNTANDNTEEEGSKGIVIEESSNNTLTHNVANGNREIGFWVYNDALNNTLINNTATFNLVGIWLENNAYNNSLTNNTANNNIETGIYLDTSSNNTVTNNTANSNDKVGIYLDSANHNNITCNWVAYNEQRGFYLSGGSMGNNISYNNIMTNGVSANDSWHYNFYNNQSDDVNATNNYWATDNSTIIAESIYDWHDDQSKGNVTFDPYLTDRSPCAPIPEAATIILFSVGLVVLAGSVVLRRRK